MTTPPTSKRVRPIIAWPGGKTRMLGKILPLIPEHSCFVEPFAGGLAVLLAKERSRLEVVNDLNGDLVALYRNLQYHMPAILAELEWTLNSRKNLHEYIAQPGITEIQKAVRWYIRNRISFGGGMTSFAIHRAGHSGFSKANAVETLRKFSERMDRVMVENVSYERCLDLYDSPDTFFFIDPPYLHAKPKNYAGWDEAQMTAFRDRVARLRGRWMVTLDDSQFNRSLFEGCNIAAVKTRNGCVNRSQLPNAEFGEIIITPPGEFWIPPQPPHTSHDNTDLFTIPNNTFSRSIAGGVRRRAGAQQAEPATLGQDLTAGKGAGQRRRRGNQPPVAGRLRAASPYGSDRTTDERTGASRACGVQPRAGQDNPPDAGSRTSSKRA